MNKQEELFEEEITAEFNIWLPEQKGDTLIGNVIVKDSNTLYGLAIRVETDEGEILQTPAHKQLQTLIKALAVGDRVKIEYMGRDLTKSSGRPLNTYRVFRKGIDTSNAEAESL